LNNIAKHAEAEQVEIVLLCHATGVTLEIRDDASVLNRKLSPRTSWPAYHERTSSCHRRRFFIQEQSRQGTTIYVSGSHQNWDNQMNAEREIRVMIVDDMRWCAAFGSFPAGPERSQACGSSRMASRRLLCALKRSRTWFDGLIMPG